jgi:hypothetical protein
MEHRGVEYRIIQGIHGPWKWSVETGTGTKSGISDSKDAAMAAAKRAIDNALDPKNESIFRRHEISRESPANLSTPRSAVARGCSNRVTLPQPVQLAPSSD